MKGSKPGMRAKKMRALHALQRAFVKEATKIGRRIIADLGVPKKERLYQPLKSAGGLAGGDKYLVRGLLFVSCPAATTFFAGVFFKLTQDPLVFIDKKHKPVKKRYMYGLNEPNYELVGCAWYGFFLIWQQKKN